jgi:PAS domain S-box-containing protein
MPEQQNRLHEARIGRGGFERWAWLPIPLLLLAIIAGRIAGLRGSYESHTLMLVLSFTFYTLVSLGTLFIIGRSFLVSGTPGLLLLECGVILWSLAGTVGDAVSHGNANINVTIFNTSILLAGLCHLTGAVLTLWPRRTLRVTPLWLGAGCALVLGSLWLVSQAAISGWLPVFFIPGQGGTLVRYCVLLSAIVMFVLSAGLLHAGQRSSRSPFTSWYALALLLLAVGLFGIMIQLSLGSVVNWLSRVAQWLGGIYLLLAALAAKRESHLPILPLGEDSRPAYYRDAMAIAFALAAAAVRLVFLPSLGTRATFITFYPAVILAALYGGVRGGLLATVLSAFLADYFWIEPLGQFGIAHPADGLGLAVFSLSCTMISFITGAMQRAQARTREVEARLQLAEERKRAVEMLGESEERLRFALETCHIGAWDLDLVDHTAFRSLEHDHIFGYAELLPQWTFEMFLQHVLPEDRAAVDAKFCQAMAAQDDWSFECRIRRPNGKVRWIWAAGRHHADPTGDIRRMAGIVQDITDRKRVEDALRFLVRCDRAPSGEDFFQGLARYLAQSLEMDFVCIDRLEEDLLAAQTVAVYFDGKFEDNISYTLADTPCGAVVGNKTCCFPRDVRHLFPRDTVLQEMKAEGYLGTILWGTQGQPIGLIAVISRKPLDNPEVATSILQLVGARAAAELERRQAQEAIARHNAVLEGINRILNAALTCETQEDLGTACLDVAEKITQSKFGFVGQINEKGLEDIAISNPGWDACKIIDAAGHRRPPGSFAIHGIYGRVLSDGMSLFTNDPVHHPDRIGIPPGHPPLDSFLGVPLISEGRTIGMIAVGNRQGGYTQDQRETLEALAPAIIEAFLRKRAEEALRESEERFRIITSSTPDHLFVQNRDLHYTLVINPQLGLAEQDLIGKTDHQILAKEDAEKLTAIKRKVLETGEPVHVEAPLISRNGETEFFSGSYVPRFDAQRRVVGLIGYFRNVTERKRMEEDLRKAKDELELRVRERTRELQVANLSLRNEITERKQIAEALAISEREFRLLAEAMPQIVWATRADGWNTYFNHQWVDYTGLTLEESYGHGWNIPFHPDDQKLAWDAWQNAVTNRAIYAVECRLRRADGIYRWWLIRGAPVLDEKGNVSKWFGTCTDINDIKQAEVALRIASLYTRSLLEASLDPLVTISPQGKITDVNEATEQVAGVSRERLVGSDFSDYFTEPPKAREGYRKVLTEGLVRDYPLTIRHVSGRTTDVLYNAVLYRDEAGNIQGVFAAARDITERKRVELEKDRFAAELQEANIELQRSNKDLEQFAYVSSHDLQEPLRMVASFVGLLAEQYKGKLDTRANQYINFAQEGALRMQRLILDLLEYSRVTTRGRPLVPIEGEKIFDHALLNLKLRIEETGAQVTHDPLPAVLGDETQLMQVFQNLIDNALKFQQKDQTPNVHVSAAPNGDDWVFTVRDNGIGIAPEHQDRIFTIFKRLHTRRHYPGNGIGLAITKRIVERHGGNICVDSKPGEGSTFYFTLPGKAQTAHE